MDYYRGTLSARRLHLLVVQDRARMPRLRTALAGHDPWAPIYGETEYALAAVHDQVQLVGRRVHVAHRLKPKLQPFVAYPRPGDAPKEPPGPPKLAPQVLSHLEALMPPS